MPTESNTITWDGKYLGMAQSMASVLFDAMDLACKAIQKKTLTPVFRRLTGVFNLNKNQFAAIARQSTIITKKMRSHIYSAPEYLQHHFKRLDACYHRRENRVLIEYTQKDLMDFYDLIIKPWDGIIIDKSPRAFLNFYPKLPTSADFQEAVAEIEAILKPLGYTNNQLDFGRRFRVLSRAIRSQLDAYFEEIIEDCI